MRKLNEDEQKVLKIIREYLKTNATFSIEKIIPFLYSKIDDSISKRDAVAALFTLIEQHYVIKGSKLLKEDVMKNAKRMKLYKFIEANPGTYNRRMRDTLHLGSNELLWHLEILEKFSFIRKTKFGKRYAYFDASLPSKYDELRFLLQNPKTRKILEVILEKTDNKNQITLIEISNITNIALQTVKLHLKKLKEQLLIDDSAGQTISAENINSSILKIIEFH